MLFRSPVYVPNLVTHGYNTIFNNDLAVVGTASPGLRFITGIFRPGAATTPPGDISFWPEGSYIEYVGQTVNNASGLFGGEMSLVTESTYGLTAFSFNDINSITSNTLATSNLANFWSDGTTTFGINVLKSNDTLTVGNNNRTSNVTMTVAEGGGQTSTTVPPFRVVALGVPFSLNTTSATTSGATLQFSGGTAGVANGEYVNGVGILPGSVVSSFNGTSVVLSTGVTGSGVTLGQSITFEPIPTNVFSISPIGLLTLTPISISNLSGQPPNSIARCANCTVGSCLTVGSGAWVFFDGSGHYTCPIP